MLNNIFTIIVFNFLLLTIGLLSLSADEEQIEWTPSKAAASYKLEVRDFTTKKVKLNIKLKTTYYKVNKLLPGVYEYRVGILNEKDVIRVFSEWTTLSVIRSLEPESSVGEIYYGGQKDRFQEIYITGINFYEDTKVEIYSTEGNIPILNLVRINDTELKFVMDVSGVQTGSYDLKIINPLNKVFIKKNFYILAKTRQEAEKKLEEANMTGKALLTNGEKNYFLRSVLVPGWGQYSSGQDYKSLRRKEKGSIFFISFIGAGILLGIGYQDYIIQKHKVDNLHDLNNLVNYPYKPPLSAAGILVNQVFNTKQANLESKWDNVINVSYALIGIYLFNLVDAYFFTGTIQSPKSVATEMDKLYYLKAYVRPERNAAMQTGNTYILEYNFRF